MKLLSLAILILLISTNLQAQFNAGTDISVLSDDNIDNNYLQISDKITSATINLGYEWNSDEDKIGLYYSPAINYFSKIINRTFYIHDFNFTYEKSFGEESESSINAEAGYFSRVDRFEYSFYDHQIYSGKFQIQHFFTETFKANGGYTFNYVNFGEMTEFSYYEHILNAQGSFYLTNTKTTLIAGASLGAKIYLTGNYDSTIINTGSGRGKKQSEQSTPSVTQFSGMLRVGQSIFENTGLSLTAQYQTNIQKESRYIISTYGVFSDDAIFDDHYGYEGLQLTIMLTQVLPFDARLRLIGISQNKKYSSLPAYDLAENLIASQRNDTRNSFSVNLTKEIESLGISLNAAYDYIVNSSNDPFFDYTNQAFNISISILF